MTRTEATTAATATRLDGMQFPTAGGYFRPTGWGLRDATGNFFATGSDNYPYVARSRAIAEMLAAGGLTPGYRTARAA